MNNKVLFIIVGVLVVALVGLGYFVGDNAGKRRTTRLLQKQYEEFFGERIDNIHDELTALGKEDDELVKDLERLNKAIEGINADMAKGLRALEKKIKKTETAKPNVLVKETRRILKSEGVEWYSGKAHFEIDPFRTNTIKLLDWEDFTLVREPLYQEKIGNLEETVVKKDAVIVNRDKTIGLQGEEIEELVEYGEHMSDAIKAIQRATKWQNIQNLAIGGAVGAGLILVIQQVAELLKKDPSGGEQ